VIPDEQMAVDAALREAEAGDLVLIFGDAITRSWKQVIQFRRRGEPAGGPAQGVAPRAPLALATESLVLEDRRREFVCDVRGVRLPRAVEADD
jgi:cyanophycin synthetase